MKFRRLKPGSLTPEGEVVGLHPVQNWRRDPIMVPRDYGATLRHTLGRCQALTYAGWRMCPGALYPRIPNNDEVALIHKDSPMLRAYIARPRFKPVTK